MNRFLESGGLVVLYNPSNKKRELKKALEIGKYEYSIKILNGKLKRDIFLNEKNIDLKILI